MSKLDDILLEPMKPVDYELLKRGHIETSEEVTAQVKKDIKALMLELIGEPITDDSAMRDNAQAELARYDLRQELRRKVREL